MRLPRFFPTMLTKRQNGYIPADYCSPQCPACRQSLASSIFSISTSCVPNSTFLVNCGSCQECIITFAITNGTAPASTELESEMESVLNLCANSTVSTDIAALQSQASRLSLLGVELYAKSAFATQTTAMATPIITSFPTATGVNMTSPQSNLTATATLTSSSAQQTGGSSPLASEWVAGPVVGSILGMATVFTVIFFTRRKYRREALAEQMAEEKALKASKDDSSSLSTAGKAQLHSECVPAKELDNSEVVPPVELPALEPVGSELSTPRHGTMGSDDWPLPMSPLPLLFALTELRDERNGEEISRKHNTYYHA